MGFVVQYAPDPRTLGSYAFESAAAPARRQNLQRSLDNAQQAAQFNAQLRQHATDRAVNQYDRQQGRAADLQKTAMQQAGYERKNQYELQQAQEKNAALIQQEQMQQQTARANQFEQTKQEWLKQGIAKYSPQNKQQLSEFQRQASVIESDPSIPPEHKDQMIANLQGKMQAIIPQIVPEDERPTPFHERAGQDIAVMNEKGQVIPLSQLGRAPKNGEMIVTGTMRNGSMSYKTQPFSNKEEDPYKDFTDPVKLNQRRAEAARDIQMELDVDYANRLAEWNDAKDAHPEDTDARFTMPRPQRFRPTPAQIDAKLFEMSGGVAGAPVPAPQQGSWPRPAMMGGYSPVQIPTQHQFRESQPQPSQGRGVGGLYRREMNRDVKLAESPAIGEMILNDPEFRQHISKNGNGDMYVGGIIWNRAVVKHSQDRPITVSSQEEAKTLPYGSKFSLNGRTGTVQ